MTDVEKTNEGAEETTEATDAPKEDQFGVKLNADGTEAVEEAPKEEATEEPKKDKDGKPVVAKKEDADDIATHPAVVALEAKIKEYGENLTGQRASHEKEVKDLKQQLADALSGKGKETEIEPMFKDIKFSKDLPKEKLEDMTDAEIILFDQNAQNQTAMNQMFKQIAENKTATVDAGKATEEAKVEDLNSSAKAEANRLAEEVIKADPEATKALAKDAKELADKIIVEFNEFNNDGISPEKLIERMKKALNNVSGYTPPKELEKKESGKPVIDGAKGKDPHGVDSIVAGVGKKNDGDYSL